jgi:hypothetical protein
MRRFALNLAPPPKKKIIVHVHYQRYFGVLCPLYDNRLFSFEIFIRKSREDEMA